MSIVLPPISALGTTWLLELFDENADEKANETHRLVSFFLSEFEAKYSRFRSDSDISILNQTGQLKNPDSTLLELLTLGQKFYLDTASIFNILIGQHLTARGYDATYSFSPQREPMNIPSPVETLVLAKERILLTAGQIDLGGYGKGFLIDQLSLYLQDLGFKYFLINGGGDMYATSDYDKPITIYLEHPSQPQTYITETTLMNQGFAASSSHKRRWKVSGIEYSHIVDTREKNTGEVTNSSAFTSPDDFGMYTKAPSAVLADAWATTLLISDPIQFQGVMSDQKISYARFTTSTNSLVMSQGFYYS